MRGMGTSSYIRHQSVIDVFSAILGSEGVEKEEKEKKKPSCFSIPRFVRQLRPPYCFQEQQLREVEREWVAFCFFSTVLNV